MDIKEYLKTGNVEGVNELIKNGSMTDDEIKQSLKLVITYCGNSLIADKRQKKPTTYTTESTLHIAALLLDSNRKHIIKSWDNFSNFFNFDENNHTVKFDEYLMAYFLIYFYIGDKPTIESFPDDFKAGFLKLFAESEYYASEFGRYCKKETAPTLQEMWEKHPIIITPRARSAQKLSEITNPELTSEQHFLGETEALSKLSLNELNLAFQNNIKAHPKIAEHISDKDYSDDKLEKIWENLEPSEKEAIITDIQSSPNQSSDVKPNPANMYQRTNQQPYIKQIEPASSPEQNINNTLST